MLKSNIIKAIKISAITIISAWFLFCLTVYFVPELFFYNPSKSKADILQANSNGFPAVEVNYTSQDSTKLYGWYIKPQSKNKIVAFFHGNSYNIGSFYHKLQPFVREGYGVFIGEYRGFGGIQGKITQSNLGADAISAVKYLHSLGHRNQDIILYGMSLGSYTSTYTAHKLGQSEPFAGLVLEVPFDSMLNIVKQRIINIFPFEVIVKDKYDNTQMIQYLNIPVLIMAAEQDKVVPIERAHSLYSYANHPKRMLTYPNAEHSNLYKYNNWRNIINWLKEHEKTK